MAEPLQELKALLAHSPGRREFLQQFGRGLGCAALATLLPACGGGSGSSDDASDDAENDAPAAAVIPRPSAEYTVLKRLSFGPQRDQLAAIGRLGIDAYIEQQLDYHSIDDGALDAEIEARFPLTLQTPPQLQAGFPDNIGGIAMQMVAATQYRQIFSRRQLYEVMVEFWSDHFNIHMVNGLGPTLKPADDRQVIRRHALGNFRDLLHASAKSPAMLFYLDNYFNLATAPNENYARELMELHSLGVDGGYTEFDVKEVARCFTGWSLRFPDDTDGDYGDFIFADSLHDNGAKLVLGNPIAAGGGQSDAEQVLDMLAAHPSTARFIATKLCRRFISDQPPRAAVEAVAAAFSASGGDIKDMLRALFASPAFRDSADLKFTRPTEYLAAVARALAPDGGYPRDGGQFWFFVLGTLGQWPFYWPTPDGYPDRHSYWASTGGLLNRWRLSFLSFSGLIPEVDVLDIDYAAMLNGADTIAGITDALTDAVLMRPLSERDRDTIIAAVATELGCDAGQQLGAAESVLVAALLGAVLISSVYFQLR